MKTEMIYYKHSFVCVQKHLFYNVVMVNNDNGTKKEFVCLGEGLKGAIDHLHKAGYTIKNMEW
jgi:hypothetical protein